MIASSKSCQVSPQQVGALEKPSTCDGTGNADPDQTHMCKADASTWLILGLDTSSMREEKRRY